MKIISVFLFAVLGTTGPAVFAAGGTVSSSPALDENRPYTGSYAIRLNAPTNVREEYQARLRDHIRDIWQVPDARVQPFPIATLSPRELRRNLNHDRTVRRFLFLGHTAFGIPDMVLATPLQREPREEGDLPWAILSAHQPRSRGARRLMKWHGHVAVSNGQQVVDRLAQSHGTNDGALEKGHVLTIEEVFRELGMLRPPNLEPVV